MSNLKQLAQMLGINQEIVNKVFSMSKNYSQDMNGLLKAIQENGGMKKVDEAMKYLNNPMVKNGLNMIGFDINDITKAYNEIKSVQLSENNAMLQQNQNSNTNTYLERINALKRK